MKVFEAKYEQGWLMLKVSPPDALRWLRGVFREGKEYDIVVHINKKTNTANKYAWALCGEIATALGITKEEAYRNAIKEIAGLTSVVTVTKPAFRQFENAFLSEHIGRNVEIIGETLEDYEVILTYGSSDFDSRQMSQLIDALVQDAKTLGIKTLDDERIDTLIDEWDKKYNERM